MIVWSELALLLEPVFVAGTASIHLTDSGSVLPQFQLDKLSEAKSLTQQQTILTSNLLNMVKWVKCVSSETSIATSVARPDHKISQQPAGLLRTGSLRRLWIPSGRTAVHRTYGRLPKQSEREHADEPHLPLQR